MKWTRLIPLAVMFAGLISPATARAQSCFVYSVSPTLPDLGPNEYYRLTGNQGSDPSTWTYVRQPGIIGGLYPGGSNVRPPAHEAAGVVLAGQIQPLDANGLPSASGKIGLASIGMSNTRFEFAEFMRNASQDTSLNDYLVFANGAAGGGTIEGWTDPNNPNYQTYWDWFNDRIAEAKLTAVQVQVVWTDVTQLGPQYKFPSGMQNLANLDALLAKELKARLPNLKILYFSTRTRSFSYFSGEPTGFENGFAVRWLIERQINGDPDLNYDPSSGPVWSPYLSWGPYLWVDGPNPRFDGRTWPLYYTSSDCLHPSSDGYREAAAMMMAFFKADTTATPWFLDAGVTPPPPPPPPPPDTTPPTISDISVTGATDTAGAVNWITNEPADGQLEFLDVCPAAGCLTQISSTLTTTHAISMTGLSASTVYRYRIRTRDASGNLTVSDEQSFETQSPPPPPPPGGTAVSSWGFASNVVTDDINGCTGCSNSGASWTDSSIYTGGFHFNRSAYLNLGSFPYLNDKGTFTLTVWIRPDFDQTSGATYNVFWDGANVGLFYLGGIRGWRASVRTTSGTIRVSSTRTSWTSGTWHQIAVTFDGTALKLYWDGVCVGSAGGGIRFAGDGGTTLLGISVVYGDGFSGDIDELRIYDYVRSDEQISQGFLEPWSR